MAIIQLSPQRERFCQARARGDSVEESIKYAGYRIRANDAAKNLRVKANRLETDPEIQARIQEILREQAARREAQAAVQRVAKQTTFDAENVTKEWIHRQAFDVCNAALNSEDFGAALKALEFMAKVEGVVDTPRRGAPLGARTPNKQDLSGNYVPDSNPGNTEETSGVDSLFCESDGGFGDEPEDRQAAGPDPQAVVRALGKARQSGRQQQAEHAELDPGYSGEGDDDLFDEAEGE